MITENMPEDWVKDHNSASFNESHEVRKNLLAFCRGIIGHLEIDHCMTIGVKKLNLKRAEEAYAAKGKNGVMEMEIRWS